MYVKKQYCINKKYSCQFFCQLVKCQGLICAKSKEQGEKVIAVCSKIKKIKKVFESMGRHLLEKMKTTGYMRPKRFFWIYLRQQRPKPNI